MSSLVQYQQQNSPEETPIPGKSSNELELDVREVWNTVLRHRWLSLCVFLGVVAVIASYSFTRTPIYQASSTVRIDGKTSMLSQLDFLSGGSGASQLSTEMEVLQSRALAGDVVDSLGLQIELTAPTNILRSTVLRPLKVSPDIERVEYSLARQGHDSIKVTDISAKRTVGHFAPGDTVSVKDATFILEPAALEHSSLRIAIVPHRTATQALLSSLMVTRPAREASVVLLKYESSDPELARDVVNTLAQRFIDRRSVIQKTEARSTTNFLRNQLDTLSIQLASSERELQSFRESQEVVNLGAEGESQVTQLAKLRAQRNDVEAQRSSLSQLLSDVRSEASSAAPTDPSPYRKILAFPALLANQTSGLYLGSLLELENKRSELLVLRKLEDPDVGSLTDRIHHVEDQVESFAKTYLDGLNNQAASLDTVLQRFSTQLQLIPAKEVEFARLARRPKVLEEIFTTLQSRLKEAEIAQAVEDPTVRIIDEAILPLVPIKPNVQINLVIAVLLGLVGGIASAFLRDKMDQTVHTREHLQRITGLPVLGLIPRIRAPGENGYRRLANAYGLLATRSDSTSSSRHLANAPTNGVARFGSRMIAISDPLNPVSEAYRGMRTNITFAQPDRVIKTLAFTSPMPGDGKSTTTANLATTLAQQGLRVLLIDADLRRGTLNTVLGLPRDPGLSNLIVGTESLDATVHQIAISETVTLDFISTGPFPPNPAELLGSQRMRDLLVRLEQVYDMIIFDTPPVNLVTDAAILGTLVDGVLLVSRASATHQGAVGFAVEQLRNVRARVLGTILNDVDFDRDVRYYSYNYEYAYQQYYAADSK